jgi:hypothetical protein
MPNLPNQVTGPPAQAAPQQVRHIFVPYLYVAVSPVLTANGSAQVPLLFDEDADFELHWITATDSIDNTNDPRPNNFSVQITDKNNSRIWSSARVPQVAMVPCWKLDRPVVISRRTNLNLDFLNLTATTPAIATIVLHGFKVIGL